MEQTHAIYTEGLKKKEYNEPALTILGKVAGLTAGGGSGGSEVVIGKDEVTGEKTCSSSDPGFC